MDRLGRDRFNPPQTDYTPRGERQQLALLRALRRRPILTTKYVGALLGVKKSHKALLTNLIKGGYLYHHPESTNHRNARYRDMCWSLTEKGDKLYEDREGTEPHRNFNGPFRHAFGVSMIGASFDIAAKQLGLTLTIRADKPVKNGHHTPDEAPFTLEYQGSRMDFSGCEFDRNTEALSGSAYNTITEKLKDYEHYFETRAFEVHGLKTAFVPFITINEQHLENLKKLVAEQVHPKLHSRFLFKVFPDFKSYDDFPPATGHIVTEPWQRIGGSFNIMETLKWTPRKQENSLPAETNSPPN